MNEIRLRSWPAQSQTELDRIYIYDKSNNQNILTLDYVDNNWQLYFWKMMFPDMYGYDNDGVALKMIGVDIYD